ncbi:MAG: hypothetical protein WBL27_04080 [Salinimicrobium sp.]
MKRSYLLLLLMITAVSFTSCSDDDDEGTPMVEPTGALVVNDQSFENNMFTISSITMSDPGWVVIHRDNGSGGPMVPDIISVPKYVEANGSTDVMIELKDGVTLQDGETLWVMLHTDDGDKTYEFDGGDVDAPIMDANGNIVVESFVVSIDDQPMLSVDDQALMNNTITVGDITLAEDGWVVVHADNGDSPQVPDIISYPVYLPAGNYSGVEVPLKDDANVMANDQVWVMLHSDTDGEAVYEFDGGEMDPPITVDGEILMQEITITDVTSEDITASFTVDDNLSVTDNQINVGTITMGQDGWVVVHADNGGSPQVPEIISEPVYLEEGDNNDVSITFDDSADVSVGDTVWVMLHNDTGIKGEYEFDGMNGLDMPIVVDGSVLVTPVVIIE